MQGRAYPRPGSEVYMPGQNGTAARPMLRLSLGDTVPERRPIELEFDNETVVLQGYVGDRRCPLDVRAEVDSARKVWAAATGAGTDAYVYDDEAWLKYVRSVLMAIVPGLGWHQAGMLAVEGEKARALLVYLEWWQEPAEETPDPEAEGESSPTMATSSAPSPSGSTSSRRKR
jgi:hypothetical protein